MLLIDFLTSTEAQSFIRSCTMSVPSLGTLTIGVEESGIYRPSRYMMYREVMASLRTLAELSLPHVQVRTLYAQLKAYWADLIDEDELCDRLMQVLSRKSGGELTGQ